MFVATGKYLMVASYKIPVKEFYAAFFFWII